jgi:hypothetical protein
MDFTNGEFQENQRRVENLILAADDLVAASRGEISQDVLRAAVVFLHSSLEEIIRNLYVRRLPNVRNVENLNKIPLLTNPPSIRPTQILLGQLASFGGMFVENVIIKSIEAFVDSFNLNNTNQLAQSLKLAEIELVDLEPYFADLNRLMARRHQIVHQMDRTNELDPLTAPLSPIGADTVRQWKVALEGFASALFIEYDKGPTDVQRDP